MTGFGENNNRPTWQQLT